MTDRPADIECNQFADALCRLLAGEAAAEIAEGRSYHAAAVSASGEAAALYDELIGEKVAQEDLASRGLTDHYVELRVKSDAVLVDPMAFAWCLPDQSDMQDIPLSLEGGEYVGRADL